MQDTSQSSTPETLSFGEKLVGIKFNPSNDDQVSKLKSLFAEITNIVTNNKAQNESTYLESILFNHTIGEVLNAQMNCVKLLTLKY